MEESALIIWGDIDESAYHYAEHLIMLRQAMPVFTMLKIMEVKKSQMLCILYVDQC